MGRGTGSCEDMADNQLSVVGGEGSGEVGELVADWFAFAWGRGVGSGTRGAVGGN